MPDDFSTKVFGPNPVDGATRVFDANGITHTVVGGPATASGPPPEGVPGYAIVRELGRGGMGVVYLARQAGLNRDVALKMVLAGGHASAAERIRFLAEAEAIAAVQHPGIVQVFDFGTHSGQPFFALEYLPGGSLADALQKALPEPKTASVLIEKLGRAIHAAHEKGIIHRDLKPSNILLSADGSPKVTDFGLARKTDSGSGLTQTGAILGTPSYMSPEQASGKHDQTGPATDVYALGALLYECLTGRPPFRAATAVDTVMQVVSDDPVPPGKLVPKLPRDLETICLKCLQKDPAKRYTSAAALADDLGRFNAGDSIIARPVSSVERGWRWARRRPALAGSALAAVTATVAVVVVVLVMNAELKTERDAAREAEREAEYQQQIAAAERKKATLRLERAVDAVERMMVRVAGEKWANRPDLQQERREVLEEAVAFFRGFGEEDSKDPIVRRQAARAYGQSAAAYLALGEYGKAREMAGVAADGYAALAADTPTDPAPLRGRAEATAMLGHVDAIGGKFATALELYQAAANLAARAVALDPKAEDSQVTLAEAYSSLAMYYSISAPPRAAEFNAKSLGIAERLTEGPAPGYKAWLILAVALTNNAAFDINQGRAADGAKKIDRARAIVPVLDKLRPPSANAAERLVITKSSLQVLHGMQLFRTGKRDDGLAEVRAGVDTIRSLASVQTKAFPTRYQLLQHELTYADMLGQDGKVADSRASLNRVDALRDALLTDHPNMTWLKSFGPTQRSNFLVLAARNGAAEEVVHGFVDLDYGLDERGTQVVRYNRACAYAQLAATGPATDRARYADKAVADLTELLDTTYFESPANRDHLDDDTDLDPLRSREDFNVFLARAKAVRPPPPPVRESAPPPRKVDLK